MAPFAPYHKWLGIPPAHQPADHYRLLGIEQFEGDADVISLAADQRMTFLRTFQSGEQSELSQKLLNEVAAAKICLLNAKEKARYDAELARKTPPDAPPPLPAGDDSQGAFAAFAVGSQTDSASSRSPSACPIHLLVESSAKSDSLMSMALAEVFLHFTAR